MVHGMRGTNFWDTSYIHNEHTLSKVNEIVTFSFSTPGGLGSTVLAIIRLCNSRFGNLFLRKKKDKN